MTPSTQKQIDDLRYIMIVTVILVFCLILYTAFLAGDNDRKLRDQLSHKADRICVNETIISNIQECSIKEVYTVDWKTGKYDYNIVANHCENFTSTKEVCTIK